ncbi:unnamed protein product [Linum tenue]|uniref:Uncharacterized protein n=1 Tax=Linum tenue TaxID=586396 RepID=A0AAV0QSA6_9ROSI|nr:unnamed protein product [Linum tenue]
MNLPARPTTLPLLGKVHNLIFSSSKLHHTLHRLALKHNPLFLLKLGQFSIGVVSPELAKEILKDHDITIDERAPLFFPPSPSTTAPTSYSPPMGTIGARSARSSIWSS